MNKGCHNISDMGQFLAERATRLDVGEVIEIIAKTPFGIEWKSSLKGTWLSQVPSLQSLVHNWDGSSDVYWFWQATLTDNTETSASVLVPSQLMQEIKLYLDELHGIGKS